jgi:hypothetical protein
MAYFYCTCLNNKENDRRVKEGRTSYRLVIVDKNEICTNCGHHAVACKRLLVHSNDLYYYLVGDFVKEKVGNVKGGLSIKSQKQCLKRAS